MLLDHLETSFKPQILDSDDGTARELKIPAPQCVVDATRELFHELNPVQKFLEDGPLVLTNDDSKRMCYQHFQQMWNTEEFGTLPNGKMFQKYMEQLNRPAGAPLALVPTSVAFNRSRVVRTGTTLVSSVALSSNF